MNITLNGTKITQDTHNLAFEKNSGVDEIVITVDTDESWSYKLDVKYPDKYNVENDALYNIIDLDRSGVICSVILTREMLPFNGKYTMQLRGVNGDKVYHSDIFEAWVKYSIEPGSTYNPVPSEFYQVEARLDDKVDEAKKYAENAETASTRMPKISPDNTWLIWDTETGDYVDTGVKASGSNVDVKAREDISKLSEDISKLSEEKTNYTNIINKPKINGVELAEDTSLDALGIGTLTDEQVSNAVHDYLAENPDAIGPQSSNSAHTYKTEDIGELFTAPANYTAWCPGNLRWDKALGKFVSLLYAAPAHVHSTAELYVTRIDPDSFVASDPVKCKYLDSDEVTDITPVSSGACSFLILSDGTYMMIRAMEDGNTYKFTSADNGETWVKESAVTGYSGCPWNMTELSNGRIIMSDDERKVGLYYSDDDGVCWTQVIPATAGGDYEAEACVLELEAGKLIAIARRSMDGAGGDSEAALFASSEDYGATWSGWKSSSIDNMRSSSCTGIIHDGIVEVFAVSRWNDNNTDYINTGKHGAIIHYMATVENALVDNFTRVGIIDYAKGPSLEYHSPCAALDDKNRMLIVHMDRGEKVSCNNRYIRGELGGIGYAITTDGASTVKAYSAKTVETLLAAQNEKIVALQYALSKIGNSGVDAPQGVFVLVKSYIAADMQKSDTFPWEAGSDFEGEVVSGYPTNDSNKNHYFQADDIGVAIHGNNHVYHIVPAANASDFYLRLTVGDGFWGHVVKDGYITVFDWAYGSFKDYAYNTLNVSQRVANGDIIEIHDGYGVVNGTRYEAPKILLADYIANCSSVASFSKHARITNLVYGAPTSIENTEDHCGFTGQNGHYYYGVEYFEKY